MDGELVAGRYRVLRPLGRGGMGDVVVARHETLSREVALKRMRSEMAANPDARTRMLREAKSLGALRHENIVDVIDAGDDGSGLFIAMELVQGETLRQRMKRGVAVPMALDIIRQVADGLAAAHDADVVHRDLKPENVMLTQQGRAKILDFGLARAVDNPDADRVTEHGVIVGTPGYIAPEVGAKGAYGPAADVYALGVIAYELVTGQAPFAAPTGMSLVLLHMMEAPPSPRVSPDVDALILDCLDKDPAKRPTPRAIAARALSLIESSSSATLTSSLRTPENVAPPIAPPLHTPTTTTLPPSPPPTVAQAAPSRALIAVGALAIAALVAVAFALGRGGAPDEPRKRPPPADWAGPPSGPLRRDDAFPMWNLKRVESQASRGAQWGPSQWLANAPKMLVVVEREPCTGCAALIDDLELLKKRHPSIGITLVVAGDYGKQAVDDDVVARARSSSIDVAMGMMMAIGESPDAKHILLGFDDGVVTARAEGVAARMQMATIAASLAR